MKTKVTVTIDGREYTLTSTDSAAPYMEEVASYVDSQIDAVKNGIRVSAIDASTMAAMNIADSYFRERTASENLRRQLKDALDDANKLKKEISDLKMENFRLSQGKR